MDIECTIGLIPVLTQRTKYPEVHLIGFYLYPFGTPFVSACHFIYAEVPSRSETSTVVSQTELLMVSDFCSRRAKQNLTKMFPREDILRCTMFAVIGGIIAVVALKLFEKNNEAEARREIVEENNLNEPPRKEPEENDERFWKGNCACSHIFMTATEGQIIYFKSFTSLEGFKVETGKSLRVVKYCCAKVFFIFKIF